MVKRKVREDAELDKHPEVRRVYDELKAVATLEVDADGTGDHLFKVYRKGRKGPKESFLQMNKLRDKCYVQWARQGKLLEACRKLWGPFVKNPTNDEGSELCEDTSTDDIIRVAKEFGDMAS